MMYKFRFIDQPQGWVEEQTHPDVPYITNLRIDPFERTGCPTRGRKTERSNTSIASSTNYSFLCHSQFLPCKLCQLRVSIVRRSTLACLSDRVCADSNHVISDRVLHQIGVVTGVQDFLDPEL